MIYNLFRKYRHVAYRQFVRWCWGYLGKNVRVVLPSCAVKAVQDAFQSLPRFPIASPGTMNVSSNLEQCCTILFLDWKQVKYFATRLMVE